jgi:small subunit ribosomal protein S9
MAIKMSKKTKAKKIIKKIKRSGSVAQAKNNQSTQKRVNLPKGKYTEGIGRRKVSTARVRIFKQKGDFLVNGMAAGQYFDEILQADAIYNRPLDLTKLKGEFTVSAQVSGGGVRGQLDAVVHGLSRALIKYDPELRDTLKKAGLLTRDDRMKETRKIGMGGKARRKRQSPKR